MIRQAFYIHIYISVEDDRRVDIAPLDLEDAIEAPRDFLEAAEATDGVVVFLFSSGKAAVPPPTTRLVNSSSSPSSSSTTGNSSSDASTAILAQASHILVMPIFPNNGKSFRHWLELTLQQLEQESLIKNAIAHDLELHPKKSHNHRGELVFAFSEAKIYQQERREKFENYLEDKRDEKAKERQAHLQNRNKPGFPKRHLRK